ncbi:hypothetical protein [Atopobacter phocae]|uniref:hypothetical protein n=1 Tax=Atopobacter phocae TaxID=136492 RepID=UPI0004AE48E2|nr:hypothetical protein [Atopobacter phocae]
MNGSSKVLINTLSNQFEFNASGLEKIIRWLLDDSYKLHIDKISEKYRKFIAKIINYHNQFFAYEDMVEVNFEEFKNYAYRIGNSREILFVDIILSVLKKRYLILALN